MRTSIKIIFLFVISLNNFVFAQKYAPEYHGCFIDGPCESYLNFLNYPYSLADLKKDTLNYKWTKERLGAIFIQSKTKLINAKFFDSKGKEVSCGTFANGNGKIMFSNREYTFKDSCLNDTTFFSNSLEKHTHVFIFEKNSLKKMIWISGDVKEKKLTVENFDQGVQHDTTFIYSFTTNISPIPLLHFSYDKYRGALWQAIIYEHGQVIERITYKKDGTIDRQDKVKNPAKPTLNRILKKNCW